MHGVQLVLLPTGVQRPIAVPETWVGDTYSQQASGDFLSWGYTDPEGSPHRNSPVPGSKKPAANQPEAGWYIGSFSCSAPSAGFAALALALSLPVTTALPRDQGNNSMPASNIRCPEAL